mgnify:FL=1
MEYLIFSCAILAAIYIFFPPEIATLTLAMTKGWGHTHTRTDIYSKRSYTRNVQLQKRNTSRNGGENMSAELDEKYENAWHSVA